MNNKKKVVALYSNQENGNNTSKNQIKKLKVKCKSLDYDVYKVYQDKNLNVIQNRIAYQEMIKNMKQGRFNLIMVEDIDILTNEIFSFGDILEELIKYNCKLELLNGIPCDKLYERMLQGYSEFDDLSNETRKEIEYRKQQLERIKKQWPSW